MARFATCYWIFTDPVIVWEARTPGMRMVIATSSMKRERRVTVTWDGVHPIDS
jgi:hypothetical protein